MDDLTKLSDDALFQLAKSTFKLESGEQPHRVLEDALRLGERESLIIQVNPGAVVSVVFADDPLFRRVNSARDVLAGCLRVALANKEEPEDVPPPEVEEVELEPVVEAEPEEPVVEKKSRRKK